MAEDERYKVTGVKSGVGVIFQFIHRGNRVFPGAMSVTAGLAAEYLMCDCNREEPEQDQTVERLHAGLLLPSRRNSYASIYSLSYRSSRKRRQV